MGRGAEAAAKSARAQLGQDESGASAPVRSPASPDFMWKQARAPEAADTGGGGRQGRVELQGWAVCTYWSSGLRPSSCCSLVTVKGCASVQALRDSLSESFRGLCGRCQQVGSLGPKEARLFQRGWIRQHPRARREGPCSPHPANTPCFVISWEESITASSAQV